MYPASNRAGAQQLFAEGVTEIVAARSFPEVPDGGPLHEVRPETQGVHSRKRPHSHQALGAATVWKGHGTCPRLVAASGASDPGGKAGRAGGSVSCRSGLEVMSSYGEAVQDGGSDCVTVTAGGASRGGVRPLSPPSPLFFSSPLPK